MDSHYIWIMAGKMGHRGAQLTERTAAENGIQESSTHRENNSGKWYTGELYAPREQQRKMVYRRALHTERTSAENGIQESSTHLENNSGKWYTGELYAPREQQRKMVYRRGLRTK